MYTHIIKAGEIKAQGLEPKYENTSPFGCMKDTVISTSDLTTPIRIQWNAMEDENEKD